MNDLDEIKQLQMSRTNVLAVINSTMQGLQPGLLKDNMITTLYETLKKINSDLEKAERGLQEKPAEKH